MNYNSTLSTLPSSSFLMSYPFTPLKPEGSSKNLNLFLPFSLPRILQGGPPVALRIMSLILTWLSKALNDPPLEHPRDLKQAYKQRYLGLNLLFHPSGPTLKGLDMHVSTPQPTPPSSVHPLGHSSGSECTHQDSICFWRVALREKSEHIHVSTQSWQCF